LRDEVNRLTRPQPAAFRPGRTVRLLEAARALALRTLAQPG